MTVTLASNFNMKCLKQISIFSTSVFKVDKKLQTNGYVKPTDKVIYTPNQKILIPLRKPLPTARY